MYNLHTDIPDNGSLEHSNDHQGILRNCFMILRKKNNDLHKVGIGHWYDHQNTHQYINKYFQLCYPCTYLINNYLLVPRIPNIETNIFNIQNFHYRQKTLLDTRTVASIYEYLYTLYIYKDLSCTINSESHT